jgi:hypothetical protein
VDDVSKASVRPLATTAENTMKMVLKAPARSLGIAKYENAVEKVEKG